MTNGNRDAIEKLGSALIAHPRATLILIQEAIDILSVCADGGKDSMDTLVAVLNAIGYTEEFAEAHPNLKVSEGVKLFLQQRADGGKSEAVQNVMNIPLDAAATMADYAPQAECAPHFHFWAQGKCRVCDISRECAPREAQPVAISDDHAHALYKLAHMTGFVGWLNELRHCALASIEAIEDAPASDIAEAAALREAQPVIDGCTEENCARCRTPRNLRTHDMYHAGIGTHPWDAINAAPTPERAQESYWQKAAETLERANVELSCAYVELKKKLRAQESAGVLTDEQIREIYKETWAGGGVIGFAHAILAANKEPQL